jgi:hypothetical protein
MFRVKVKGEAHFNHGMCAHLSGPGFPQTSRQPPLGTVSQLCQLKEGRGRGRVLNGDGTWHSLQGSAA